MIAGITIVVNDLPIKTRVQFESAVKAFGATSDDAKAQARAREAVASVVRDVLLRDRFLEARVPERLKVRERMVLLSAPNGVTSFSRDGLETEVAENGTIEVPEHVATVLKSHGFKDVVGPISFDPNEEIDVPRKLVVLTLLGAMTPRLTTSI